MPGSASWARARPSGSSSAASIAAGADRWTRWPTRYAAEHLPVGRRRRGGATSTRSSRRADTRRRIAALLEACAMMTAPARSQLQALQPRNATEDAILAAAREVLGRGALRRADAWTRSPGARSSPARRSTSTSTTSARSSTASSSWPSPTCAPRRRRTWTARASRASSCASRSTRIIGVVNANEDVLLLAAQLFGPGRPPARRVGAATSAASWPTRTGASARDQERGIAPDDIDADQRAGAVRDGGAPRRPMEIIRGGNASHGVGPRAGGAVVAGGLLAPGAPSAWYPPSTCSDLAGHRPRQG